MLLHIGAVLNLSFTSQAAFLMRSLRLITTDRFRSTAVNLQIPESRSRGHLDYDMQIVYTAKLHRNFILQQVAQVLREPEERAIESAGAWEESVLCPVVPTDRYGWRSGCICGGSSCWTHCPNKFTRRNRTSNKKLLLYTTVVARTY